MIPESRNGLLSHTIVLVTALIVIEHCVLVFAHDVGRWLRLDTSPEVANVPFKQSGDRWRDLATLTVFSYLKSSRLGELV